MIDKQYLLEIEQLESTITSMKEWNDLCWAKSVDDLSCNDQAMVSGISWLKQQGIDDLTKASQDEIDKAFMNVLMDDALW